MGDRGKEEVGWWMGDGRWEMGDGMKRKDIVVEAFSSQGCVCVCVCVCLGKVGKVGTLAMK